MKLNRKLQLAISAIESITRHDDEPLEVRRATAARLQEVIDMEMTAANERVRKRIAGALTMPEEAKPEQAKPGEAAAHDE